MRLSFRRCHPLSNSFLRWPQRSSFQPCRVAQAISSSRVIAIASVLLAAVDEAARVLNRLPDVVPAVAAKLGLVEKQPLAVGQHELAVDRLRLIAKRAFDVGLCGHGSSPGSVLEALGVDRAR